VGGGAVRWQGVASVTGGGWGQRGGTGLILEVEEDRGGRRETTVATKTINRAEEVDEWCVQPNNDFLHHLESCTFQQNNNQYIYMQEMIEIIVTSQSLWT
jgi:hypothetical protein